MAVPDQLLTGWKRARERFNTPEWKADARQHNRELLKLSRETYGRLNVRILPGVIAPRNGVLKGGMWNYRTLKGEHFKLIVSEPVDVWELLTDLGRFLMAWRPSRLRSERGEAAARDCLAKWEGIAGDLRQD